MSHRKTKRDNKKRIHYKQRTSMQTPKSKPSTIQLPRPDTNGRQQIVIVPEFPSADPRALIPRSPQGNPGMYRITFFFSIPGKEHFRDELDLKKLMESGDSLLLIPQEAAQVNVTIFNDQEVVIMTIAKNAHGALSSAQLRLNVSSFLEAETNSFNIVMPLLSRWSYLYDVALDITGYHVIEEQTDTEKWMFGLVGKAKALGFTSVDPSKPVYRPVFSAYREALNATNLFYQLLCFYKVIEGVKKLRTTRRVATLSAGNEYREPSDERIPAAEGDCGSTDPLVLESFRPYLGKKFTVVLDQMREVLRNAIAHLDPTGDTLDADKYEDVAKCEQALPVIKYISRVMFHNELQTDPDYSKVSIS